MGDGSKSLYPRKRREAKDAVECQKPIDLFPFM